MVARWFVVSLVAVVARGAAAQDPLCPTCQPPFAVSVAPSGGAAAGPLNSGPWSVVFTVENTGTVDDHYTLTCSSTGGITCGTVTPSSVDLLPGSSAQVTVSYSIGASIGQLWLTAAGESTGSGWYDVTANPTVTLVVPTLTSGSRSVVRNRQPIVRALFSRNGSPLDTTQTILKWRGETVTALARHNRGLVEWDVDSTRWLAVGDSALIEVTACAQNGVCATVTRWAVLPNDDKPVLGFTGMPFEALGRAFSMSFGPGLAVIGAEVETGLATPSYVSMGVSRSAGLVYSTRQSYPRALVPVDLELTWPVGTPDQIKMLLWDGAVRLDSVVLAAPSCTTGSARRCRTVLQGDFSVSSFSAPTRKLLTVEARITSGGTTHIATDSVEVVLVDRRTTRYGSGWWPAGVLQLVSAGSDRVLVGPTGTAAIYRGNGDSVYLSPPGDFTALLKTPAGWELRPRGSTAKLVFDSNGRLVKSVDRNGNRDSIAYSGSSDQVTSIRDPLNKTFTFTYDGNAKLATITDPAGLSARETRVLINATTNQLTYDSIASAPSRPYTTTYVYQTYPGTNTVVLTKRVGVIADTTIVTYDSTFRRRPTHVALPLVQDETGAWVKPVIQYTALERQGWQTLRSLDSVYVEVKDPRNNWTRSLLNRWGRARRTWDALGILGQAEYTEEGVVLWSEGKTGDSSRVYHRYDSLRRLVRSYIVRSNTDTLRLDSLVYDANNRVIEIVRNTGGPPQSWYTTYDGNGNVLTTITPNGDTTRYWYRADGLLDSTRAPTETRARRLIYETVWKQPFQMKDENGTIVAQYGYDDYGRTFSVHGKAPIRVSGTEIVWQWRKIESFYTVANQVDSTRVMRTTDCLPQFGCNDPTWPEPSDTLLTQRVGYRFDRGGRDSLRLNDRGIATLYRYDRLGRLVSRRPWVDSMAVKDSLVYDVAGNVKKTITRRGDVIVSNVDSRNRDTLTTIPGVGDVRSTFGGSLDQLTRLWIANYVDSIGGVNPELRWGYDQRGRLRADTSFTGVTARATSFAYDAYERLSTTIDPIGTWTTRYEAKRGYPNKLITPFSDSVTYTFDQQSRPLGPYWRSSGPLQSRVPTFSEVGALKTLPHTVETTPSYVAGNWDRAWNPDSSGPPLLPVWIEQHGAGASVDSLRDSVSYDGWDRVTAWVQRKLGTSWVARDTFRFDRVGNIRTTAGAETYDVVTGRLLTRTDGGGTWSYSYDRAGNLVQAVQGGTTWVYGYDALNRLRSVRRNGTLIARYAYDVLGRRIAKRVSSAASGGTVAYTRFVYRGAHVAFETDSAGAIGLRYVWGLATDDLLAMQDAAGNAVYVVQDKLRSVRGLVKRDGTWVLSQRFGPYGERIAVDSSGSGPGFALRYRWTGREYDAETGWYYFRARYLDPAGRRFVQEDPIGYGGGGNLYAYAGGNPLDARDPSGLMFTPDRWPYFSCELCGFQEGAGYFMFDGALVPLSSAINFGLTANHGEWSGGSWSPLTPFEVRTAQERFTLGCIGRADCNPDPGFLSLVHDFVTALADPIRAASLNGIIEHTGHRAAWDGHERPTEIGMPGAGGFWNLELFAKAPRLRFMEGGPRAHFDPPVYLYRGSYYSSGTGIIYARGYVFSNGYFLFEAYPFTYPPGPPCGCYPWML